MNTRRESALSLVQALRKREISAVELLDSTIAHAERVADAFNPFGRTLYERALTAARAADKKLDRGTGGPLCGLPVTVKDSQWLAGVPCANGSRTLENFVPEQSSLAIQRLEDAGAVIFAKTTCPEFSLVGITESELYGRTCNPWNAERTPGGSSGGAATAVAAGAGSLSLGGDGGGSIRIPAAFCGVVGFKPSFGVVPRQPGFSTWQSIVSYGPIARSVGDARLMYSVLAQTDEAPQAAPTSLKGLRVIVSEDLGFAPLDDDVRDLFGRTVETLAGAGAKIVPHDRDMSSSVATWAATARYDTWRHQQHQSHDLDQLTRTVIEFGSQFSDAEFDAAQRHRETLRRNYDTMFAETDGDILITPTVGCEAFGHGHTHPPSIGDTAIELPWLDWAGLLYDANLTGMPACSLPMGFGDEGLPCALQVTGPVGADARVLTVAEQIEQVTGWPHRQWPQEDGSYPQA